MSESRSEFDHIVGELAERLYEWSGGIFWRGESTWQDIHRDEARQWFAYAALLDRLAPAKIGGSRCLGTDCPECETARRHYLATGCLVADCPRDHDVSTTPGEASPS